MTTTEQTGGAQWELETAWGKAVEARKAGDIEGEARGMRLYADGLVNASYSGIERLVLPLSTQLDKLDRDMDLIVDAVKYIRTTVDRVASAQKKSDARLKKLEKQMTESQQDRAQIHREIAALREEFGAYTSGSKRGEFEDRLRQLENQVDRGE